jgi:peptidoglycan/LPS O-acetylase OafA/YrhL
MKLSSVAQGRNNNFNLIRIVAALAVLVTHSFVLSSGNPDDEPLRQTLGMTPGSIAVDVFFVTSGLLVTASLLRSESVVAFAWSRCLRIFPRLLVMLLLTVFLVGPLFTTLQPASYLLDPRTHAYLIKGATLVSGILDRLPGVFESNPYPASINGSLWTMPYEVRMYVLLAVLWAVVHKAFGLRGAQFTRAVQLLAILSGVGLVVGHFISSRDPTFLRLFFMFFAGAALFVSRERVRLSARFFLLALVASTVAAIDQHLFFVVYTVSLPYLVIYLAYVPSDTARRYNKVGDYSYGIYIYAFPVQQSLAALMPGISAMAMMAASLLATTGLAALSWHFIERHAIGLRKRSVASPA